MGSELHTVLEIGSQQIQPHFENFLDTTSAHSKDGMDQAVKSINHI